MPGDRQDLSVGALCASVEALRISIDRLIDDGKLDHDAVTKLQEQTRQLWIEVKALGKRVEGLAPSEATIRADEQERVWKRGVESELAALKSTKEAVKTEAISLGKAILIGAGGGGIVKLLSMLEGLWR